MKEIIEIPNFNPNSDRRLIVFIHRDYVKFTPSLQRLTAIQRKRLIPEGKNEHGERVFRSTKYFYVADVKAKFSLGHQQFASLDMRKSQYKGLSKYILQFNTHHELSKLIMLLTKAFRSSHDPANEFNIMFKRFIRFEKQDLAHEIRTSKNGNVLWAEIAIINPAIISYLEQLPQERKEQLFIKNTFFAKDMVTENYYDDLISALKKFFEHKDDSDVDEYFSYESQRLLSLDPEEELKKLRGETS